MIIKNGIVYTEDGRLEPKVVVLKEDIICDICHMPEVEQAEDEVVDASGCYVIPGLTDIHFHGCIGHDFCDGTQEAMSAMARYEASIGVTTIVPATMTLPEETLYKICETAAAYKEKQAEDEAILCGINMEGPFIAMSKKGAQNGLYIHQPDIGFFDRLNRASGYMIKLVALAPEVEGSREFIQARKDQVVISIAHTACDYDEAKDAIDLGAHHVTHLYNAMNPFSHRVPGPIGAAAEGEKVEVELITDGVHIHPACVRTTFKMFGDDRIILISDSMEATGLDDGQYELGGQAVFVHGNKATLADGTIAGSATNLPDCLRSVVKMGIPLESAIKCAAVNSAKSVGIYNKYGSITPGKIANLVLLDQKDLSLKAVILRGKRIS